MNICLVQTDPSEGRQNVQNLQWAIQINPTVDLFVTPELFAIGFDSAAKNGPLGGETFPNGSTCVQIFRSLKGKSSAVVCGLLEQYGSHFYNAAAVIGDGWMDRYWQKHPATTVQGRTLKVQSGDYRKIMLPSQWSMGLMVCNDYFRATEFFEEYKKRNVHAVVLIADSSTRQWLTDFPPLCEKFKLPAIVCNAAGPNGGGSCIFNSAGQPIHLRTAQGQAEWNYLPDIAIAVVGTI